MAATAVSGAFVAMAGGVAHADGGDGGGADGTAAGSPGVGSGNAVAVPVDIPVNVCGNGLQVVGLLNPTVGGAACVNATTPTPAPPTPRPRVIPPEPPRVTVPPTPVVAGTPVPVRAPAPAPRPSTPPAPQGERLAETGAETTGLAVAGIAFLLGGTILYRRAGAVRA
ncbi:chaplin [Yinghuangia sp. YIM S09857]|uniref:chaplin n=1 Tax=Yinghuangia sp. YIM S09857 TaxID=3436929 RepID=UPI003F53B62A